VLAGNRKLIRLWLRNLGMFRVCVQLPSPNTTLDREDKGVGRPFHRLTLLFLSLPRLLRLYCAVEMHAFSRCQCPLTTFVPLSLLTCISISYSLQRTAG
jgi:hypothetical protein